MCKYKGLTQRRLDRFVVEVPAAASLSFLFKFKQPYRLVRTTLGGHVTLRFN